MRRKIRIRPVCKTNLIVPVHIEEIKIEDRLEAYEARVRAREEAAALKEKEKKMRLFKLALDNKINQQQEILQIPVPVCLPPPPPPPKDPKTHPYFRLYSRAAQKKITSADWDNLGNHCWRLELERSLIKN